MISDCKAFWTWVWTSFGPLKTERKRLAGGLGREHRQALLSGNINSQGIWCPYGMWHSQQRVFMWPSESRVYFSLLKLIFVPMRHWDVQEQRDICPHEALRHRRAEGHQSTWACGEEFFIASEGGQVSLLWEQRNLKNRNSRKEMYLSMSPANLFQTLSSAPRWDNDFLVSFGCITRCQLRPRFLASERWQWLKSRKTSEHTKFSPVRWPIITRSDPLSQPSNSDSTFKNNDYSGFNEAWALTTCQGNIQRDITKWGNVLALCQTNTKAKAKAGGWRKM